MKLEVVIGMCYSYAKKSFSLPLCMNIYETPYLNFTVSSRDFLNGNLNETVNPNEIDANVFLK